MKLTEREKQVEALMFKGFSTKEIAAKLFVTAHTVKAHICKIYQKYAVKSRYGLYVQVITDLKNRVAELEQKVSISYVEGVTAL